MAGWEFKTSSFANLELRPKKNLRWGISSP
ncbi:hypothetical protein H4I96_00093 [Botrytis cinerea]